MFLAVCSIHKLETLVSEEQYKWLNQSMSLEIHENRLHPCVHFSQQNYVREYFLSRQYLLNHLCNELLSLKLLGFYDHLLSIEYSYNHMYDNADIYQTHEI